MNVNVPPNGEVSSLTGIAEHGSAAFRTTHWSLVLTAQEESPTAHEALEKLCRIYWRPIYSFVQRQDFGLEEAKDITRVFLRSYWNAEVSMLSARNRDDFVLTCLER